MKFGKVQSGIQQIVLCQQGQLDQELKSRGGPRADARKGLEILLSGS